MVFEFIKFVVYSLLIVIVSKYLLVTLLRKMAETLELKARTVGKIAGVATSIPELLTVSLSAFSGLMETGIFNVIGSNIINVIQYFFSIILNKNGKVLKIKVIKIDIIIAIITIIIPFLTFWIQIEDDIKLVVWFILIGILLIFISNFSHRDYEKNKEEKTKLEKEIEGIDDTKKGRLMKIAYIILYSFGIFVSGIILFFIGRNLSDVLENLCLKFGISQILIGLLLGVVTSLPELITFFESQKHYSNNNNDTLGVIEATNNLVMSNWLNLFVVHNVGLLIFWMLYS